jgi:hypothetical protein
MNIRIYTARHFAAAIRPRSELISVSLAIEGATQLLTYI